MNGVVVQHLRLRRVSQFAPRPVIYTVDEAAPQLRQARLDALPHAGDQRPSGAVARPVVGDRKQQISRRAVERGGEFRTCVIYVGQRRVAFRSEAQCQRRVVVIPVDQRQDSPEDVPTLGGQQTQLEAEEPALTRLAEVVSVLVQPPHSPAGDGVADRHGLAVKEMEVIVFREVERYGAHQLPSHPEIACRRESHC